MARMTVKTLAAAVGVSPATISTTILISSQRSCAIGFWRQPRSSAIRALTLLAGRSGWVEPKLSGCCYLSGSRTRSLIRLPSSS